MPVCPTASGSPEPDPVARSSPFGGAWRTASSGLGSPVERRAHAISVVTLNYNSEQFLPDWFATLARQTLHDFEVILADNASHDAGVDLARKLRKEHGLEDRMTIVENGRNLGFCEGNNAAARLAKGKYLLFLNVDTKLDERCLEELVKAAEDDPSIGAWQSYILNYDDSLRTAGNNFDIFATKAQPREWRTFFPSGACLMMSRELFNTIGGFDSALFLINDDADLGWRVRLMGFGIGCATRSICYHWGNYATGGVTARMVYFQQRNRIRIFLKNYSGWSIAKRIVPLLGLVSLFGVYFSVLNRNAGYAGSVFKAYLWNIAHIRDTLRARQRVQRLRRVPDSEVEKHMIPYSSELYSFFSKMRKGRRNAGTPVQS